MGGTVSTTASTTVGAGASSGPIDYFADLAGKPPARQLAALQEMLDIQNAIKEGAENLLNMPIANVLREQLVREQDAAQGRIEAIRKRIQRFTDSVDFTELEDKSPAEQMEALREMLEVQNRVAAGAQNLLNMRDLLDGLRKEVVLERDVAVARIEAIRRRIETYNQLDGGRRGVDPRSV
ncbi:hypothetical protein DFH08DRAFT_835654 [Mycena albidolilacea]|uniref:Uncharacterized protein n=1 Tax=Mycena albidolilacea TaxID=1033008 RepID=A0AAD7ARY5_9AGAR|nr:hypothetical protein DFH08DRAFT_835654 [Mycena albidolilacea]